jgi:hypothetical protein
VVLFFLAFASLGVGVALTAYLHVSLSAQVKRSGLLLRLYRQY